MDCQYQALWTHIDVRTHKHKKHVNHSYLSFLHIWSKQGEGYQSSWCLIEHFVKYLLLFFVCHFSILPYQFHWKHKVAKRDIPAATILVSISQSLQIGCRILWFWFQGEWRHSPKCFLFFFLITFFFLLIPFKEKKKAKTMSFWLT